MKSKNFDILSFLRDPGNKDLAFTKRILHI